MAWVREVKKKHLNCTIPIACMTHYYIHCISYIMLVARLQLFLLTHNIFSDINENYVIIRLLLIDWELCRKSANQTYNLSWSKSLLKTWYKSSWDSAQIVDWLNIFQTEIKYFTDKNNQENTCLHHLDH